MCSERLIGVMHERYILDVVEGAFGQQRGVPQQVLYVLVPASVKVTARAFSSFSKSISSRFGINLSIAV